MPRVAIVIVTYNSAAEIGACLDAVRSVAPGDTEIVVIDNASTDATSAAVCGRGIRLIANDANAGFAAAVNQGVRATSAPLILSLNPDARLVGGIEAMAATFDSATEKVGAVGGMLIGPDNAPQRGFMVRNLPSPAALIFEVLGINRLWLSNRVNWHYRCLGLDLMRKSRIEQPAGAFLMFPRAAWEAVGGFDERYWPVWFEDVDFCTRLRSAGYCAYYNPAAVAKHVGSHSIASLAMENRAQYWYGSLLEYAGTHYRSPVFRTTCVAVAVGAVVRGVCGLPRFGFKALAVYGGIVGVALRRAFSGPAKSGVSVG